MGLVSNIREAVKRSLVERKLTENLIEIEEGIRTKNLKIEDWNSYDAWYLDDIDDDAKYWAHMKVGTAAHYGVGLLLLYLGKSVFIVRKSSVEKLLLLVRNAKNSQNRNKKESVPLGSIMVTILTEKPKAEPEFNLHFGHNLWWENHKEVGDDLLSVLMQRGCRRVWMFDAEGDYSKVLFWTTKPE